MVGDLLKRGQRSISSRFTRSVPFPVISLAALECYGDDLVCYDNDSTKTMVGVHPPAVNSRA
jgi:hypothetical protein